RIQIILGNTGTYSANNEFHASGVQNTNTVVVCTPNPVTYGGNTSCTATVTGATTGTITWTTDGSGSFSNSGSCTLSGGSGTITSTPSHVGTGTHKITAIFSCRLRVPFRCQSLRRITPASDPLYDCPSLTRPQTRESRARSPAVGSSTKQSVVR